MFICDEYFDALYLTEKTEALILDAMVMRRGYNFEPNARVFDVFQLQAPRRLYVTHPTLSSLSPQMDT